MKRILGITFVLFFMLTGLVGCGTQEAQLSQERTPQERTPQEEVTNVSVTKSAMRLDWGEYYIYSISGKATNNTDEYISRVIINITVYDDVDVAMKKISSTINGLDAHETKEFSCSYKVYKIQGRVPSKSEITNVTYS